MYSVVSSQEPGADIMTRKTTVPADPTKHTKSGAKKSERLYYLDWLRVLLIFGVFLFHVLSPFAPLSPWHIKNGEQSIAAMAILRLFDPWGIPLFFLVAGAASKLALRRRSRASATKCPLTFIMLLRYRFYDPMIRLSFIDLWS